MHKQAAVSKRITCYFSELLQFPVTVVILFLVSILHQLVPFLVLFTANQLKYNYDWIILI